MPGNKNTLNTEIGQRLGVLRTRAGETQEELGAEIGVSREIINHWERGSRKIKAEAIKKLAEHFKVSADYLLGLREHPTDDPGIEAACSVTGLSVEAISRVKPVHSEIETLLMCQHGTLFLDALEHYRDACSQMYTLIDTTHGQLDYCRETPREDIIPEEDEEPLAKYVSTKSEYTSFVGCALFLLTRAAERVANDIYEYESVIQHIEEASAECKEYLDGIYLQDVNGGNDDAE